MAESGMLDKVASFRNGEDLRVMYVGEGASGEALLREDLCGPSVVDAYGADAARLQVNILGDWGATLKRGRIEVFGAKDLREFAADEKNDILDLMDFCDRNGVAYTKMTLDAK